MSTEVDNELTTIGARDALVLAAICVPPDQPRGPGNLRHAFLLRLVGARSSMRRLEQRGYLEPGWTIDYQGAHCQVTERGTRMAKAVAITVNLAPNEGRASNASVVLRVLLNRRFHL